MALGMIILVGMVLKNKYCNDAKKLPAGSFFIVL